MSLILVTRINKDKLMPTSINDMYKSAYNNEISWEQALLLTGLLYVGTEGLVISPPPTNKNDYQFFSLRLKSLLKYTNNNPSYQKVIKAIEEYCSLENIALNKALHVFFKITKLWDLTDNEERILLGFPSKSIFYKWKEKNSTTTLQQNTLERISYVVGINNNLVILLPSVKASYEWVKKPNTAPLFHGKTALDHMLTGNIVDLADIYNYLKSQTT